MPINPQRNSGQSQRDSRLEPPERERGMAVALGRRFIESRKQKAESRNGGESAQATSKRVDSQPIGTPMRPRDECRMQNAECRKPPKDRCKPGAGHRLGRNMGVALLCSSCALLVLLLCCSCVALVSLLFSGGGLRRTTAAPSSPKLVLSVLVGWLFTCNRVFR